MIIRPLVATISCVIFFSSLTAFADNTKDCADQQQKNCGRFCMMHNGMQSCIIDIDKREGTCTCTDGATHTKS